MSFNLNDIQAKKRKLDEQLSSTAVATTAARHPANRYLKFPILAPTRALQRFLMTVQEVALTYLPEELAQVRPITHHFCEVEARLGILMATHSYPARRVTSSGAKHAPDGSGVVVPAFDCSNSGAILVSGVSRSHFIKWTAGGNAESNPISVALGCRPDADAATVKRDIMETELVETVYGGYANDSRLVYQGVHPPPDGVASSMVGVLETKEKLTTLDATIPAAPYDLRITLSSEKVLTPAVHQHLVGWKSRRVKRRRSFARRDKSIAWQIDVTEVTTTTAASSLSSSSGSSSTIEYEIETELRDSVLLQLINETDDEKRLKLTSELAAQLWWIMTQLNPSADALDVGAALQPHPDLEACALALAQCGVLRTYLSDVKKGPHAHYQSPIVATGENQGRHSHGHHHHSGGDSGGKVMFPGCMPVNFSRHNLEEIQRESDNAYYLSEKTDGVRHFLIFTGRNTAVLVDRAMRCKQPCSAMENHEPFRHVIGRIQPGTVFDGEVVMNRRGRKPRPIFIVFDVLAISTKEPVLHLPFEKRLQHLQRCTFAKDGDVSVFDNRLVGDASISLPLILKKFVKRTEVDTLLSYVSEERGMRCYHNGDAHYHLTDGIIFQPNRPYVCGTDLHLLKWKYLDTVTIDVEILDGDSDGGRFGRGHVDNDDDEDSTLCTGVRGTDNTSVDMTQYILLPKSERMRLEADRHESRGCRIAEVGFDPETGEWYYLTMRGDKVAPNHISTVLGTLLELAESLSTDELRYRMSIPSGVRDTYRKDMRGMLKQLLDHQRKRLKGTSNGTSNGIKPVGT